MSRVEKQLLVCSSNTKIIFYTERPSFLLQARQFAKRFFWTGGRVNHAGDVVVWQSGKTEGIGAPGTRFWSHTGG